MTEKQKEIIKNFSNKMLEDKLDFLPIEESVELYNNGIKLDTRFWWVFNNEEIDIEFNGNNLEEIKQEMKNIFGLENFVIGKSYDEFEEFTESICPAPTYIDLIKQLGTQKL